MNMRETDSSFLRQYIPAAFQNQSLETILETYLLIVEQLPMSIILLEYVDPDTLLIVTLNQTAANLPLGGTAYGRDALGKNLLDFMEPSTAENTRQVIAQCVASQQMIQLEIPIHLSDGAQYWFENSTIPIFNQYQQITHFLSVNQDITQRKAQASLLQQQHEYIQRQSDALTELSTPILSISDEVLLMPLIGLMDSSRVDHLTNTLLSQRLPAKAGSLPSSPAMDDRASGPVDSGPLSRSAV
jgi:PAS domain S-box-containing protein